MSDAKRIAEQLVEDGLQAYSEGRLDEALAKWLGALSHFPQDSRAQQYLRYVEENRPALEQSFAYVRAATGPQWRAVTGEGHATLGEESAEPTEVMQQAPGPAPEVAAEQRPFGARSKTPSAELLSALNWDTVRVAAEAQEVTETARSATPAGLPAVEPDPGLMGESMDAFRPRSLGNEDLTPRIELVDRDRLFGAQGDDPIWQERPGEPQPTTRPVARVEATTDFDAPEQTTGSLVVLTAPERSDEERPTGENLAAQPSVSDDLPVEATDVWVRNEPQRRQADFESDSQVTTSVRRSAPRIEVDLDIQLEETLSADDEPIADVADPESVVQRFDGLSDVETRDRAEEMMAGARRLFAQGSHEGALWLSERVLMADPTNAGALEMRDQSQTALLRDLQAQLKDLDEVPAVQMPQEQILWHKLDHRAGFLLSRVDGVLSYGDILDISGMSTFEAYRILIQLIGAGVIGPSR